MQDVFEFPDYDGSYEKLEEFILNLDEDYEIHIINTGCMAKALLNLFKSMDEKSDKLTVFFDD
jgi:NADH/NAD ratio-sensing transcriptional regulator Rex